MKKCSLGVVWYAPGKNKKIAESTAATNDFIIEIVKEYTQKYGELTIKELKELASRDYYLDIETKQVLDAYINGGYGDYKIELYEDYKISFYK